MQTNEKERIRKILPVFGWITMKESLYSRNGFTILTVSFQRKRSADRSKQGTEDRSEQLATVCARKL